MDESGFRYPLATLFSSQRPSSNESSLKGPA